MCLAHYVYGSASYTGMNISVASEKLYGSIQICSAFAERIISDENHFVCIKEHTFKSALQNKAH